MEKPTTPNAVWIATALLHKENPQRDAFQTKEIFNKVQELGLQGAADITLSIHISTHCVATSKANPDTHRKLTRLRNGWFRLYKKGDEYHPSREKGQEEPMPGNIPSEYQYLLEWYKNEYCDKIKTEKTIDSTDAKFGRVEQNKVQIPKEITDALDLQEGDFVAFMIQNNGEILLKKAKMKLEI